MSKTAELLAIGGAYIDINSSQFPFDKQGLQVETETVGKEYLLEPGGSAINLTRLCSALEVPAVFTGKVGHDDMGQLLGKLLLKDGVKPELIEDPAVMTNLSFNMVNEDGDTIMAVVGSANQSLTSDEVYERASDQLNSCTHLFIGGCFKMTSLLPAFEKLIYEAKDRGVKVALDHGRLNNGLSDADKETVKSLAKAVDYYLPSKGEFLELWNVPSIEDGLRKLDDETTGVVIVKDGKNGAATFIDGQIVTIPALDVVPINTVGAGDSFNAGFIAAQIDGTDLTESMRFGCVTAALKISQAGLPKKQSVADLLR